MDRSFTEKQLDRAGKLLAAGQANERHIEHRLGALLEDLGLENIPSFHIPEAGGSVDLYLPRRRVCIETKDRGLVDNPDARQPGREESALAQLKRYVFGQMERESKLLPLDGPTDRPWTGILTDGRVWHVWRYASGSKPASDGDRMEAGTCPASPNALLRLLVKYVGGEPIGKPWIPKNPAKDIPDFQKAAENLADIHANLEGVIRQQTNTKYSLWLDLLRTANMEPESDAAKHRLFVSHSFLVALARGVIASLGDSSDSPDPKALLGDGFIAWILATHDGRVWAGKLMKIIHDYEWRLRPGDVLRPLYEAFVDEKDRRAFGEFYTPDWLAEMAVAETLDERWCDEAIQAALTAERAGKELEGVGVLDPACGSGTFLYHAARRLLRSPVLEGVAKGRQADAVARLVNGIDVHPVAAEMARATLRRALPADPADGVATLRIYEGDSLLVEEDEAPDSSLQLQHDGVRITGTQEGDAVVPGFLLERATFAQDLRRLIDAAQRGKPVPADLSNSTQDEKDRKALEHCRAGFAKLIRREGNSIWGWYVINTTGPRLLHKRKVDRIVANPPWVAMTEVQAERRKRVLEQFAARPDMDLWTGSRDAPHFDIAQLFIKRARQLYLAAPDSDPAAWIVKKAALRSGGWRKFREWYKCVNAQTLDLQHVQPFGGGDARRCCVLFDRRPSRLESGTVLEAVLAGKERPLPHMTAVEAQSLFHVCAAEARPPQSASGYVDDTPQAKPLFRQGATVTPKVLVVLDKNQIRAGDRPGTRKVVTTKSNKRPWEGVAVQEGDAPERWLHNLLTSTELLPFACMQDLPKALVPTDENGRLEEDPGNKFWAGLEQLWKEYRGKGRNTPETLLGRLDYNRALTLQLGLRGRDRTLVLHPTSGDIMRAARSSPRTAIVQHTIHYFDAPSPSEAAFLVAVLNAPCLSRAFLESRTSGRHFTNNPWRHIPIPRFDEENDSHRQLVTLCEQAEEIAEDWLCKEGEEHPYGQVAASKRIRTWIRGEGVFDRMDDAVRSILPDHAEGA